MTGDLLDAYPTAQSSTADGHTRRVSNNGDKLFEAMSGVDSLYENTELHNGRHGLNWQNLPPDNDMNPHGPPFTNARTLEPSSEPRKNNIALSP